MVDLGSGSGLDLFFAANQVGSTGRVIGVDFTVEQLDKARQLATDGAYDQVELREGRIEDLPVDDASSDCVISNGVVNLSPEKDRVFAEAARVLRPGGRLAIADIVTEQQLKEAITCDANLWAACIGGAAQEDAYRAALEGAGLQVTEVVANPYRFISDQALGASEKYGVKSASILAVKEQPCEVAFTGANRSLRGMSAVELGRVAAIWRYPVKSMAAQGLEEADV